MMSKDLIVALILYVVIVTCVGLMLIWGVDQIREIVNHVKV